MAVLGAPNSKNRPAYRRGLFVARSTCGKVAISRWPEPRGAPGTPYQKTLVDRFRSLAVHWRKMHPRETWTVKEIIARFVRKNRGQKGSAIIRERDWILRVMANRMWAVFLDDGSTWWPEPALRDVSDALDCLEPLEGSMLVRTCDTWLNTVNCLPGTVLMLTPCVAVPQCCEPARLAASGEQVGGYGP